MTLIINTIIDKGPIIFLRLAEGNVGETDAIIASSYNSEFNDISVQYVNLTQINSIYEDKYSLSPRKDVLFDFYIPQSTFYLSDTGLPTFSSVQARSFRYTDGADKRLITQDTQQEKDINAGKDWNLPKLGLGECYVPSSMANSFNLNKGSFVYMKFIYTNEMIILWDHYLVRKNITTEFIPKFTQAVVAPCKVAGTFTSAGGKLATSDGENAIFMEIEHYYEWIGPYTGLEYTNTEMSGFRDFLKTKWARGYDFADYVVMNFPDPRIDYYKDSDYDNLQKKVVSYTNNLVTDLGFFPESVSCVILEELQTLSLALVFLGLIFSIVAILFVILSILLIYSLLMVTVEEKSFEIGIYRMVGLNKFGLVSMVLLKAFFFVIPAVIAGFLVSVL
jgi:hypothetical protein